MAMVAPDTQNARIGPAPLPTRRFTVANFVSNIMIVGASGAFLVALIGFLISNDAILVAGAFALALVSFIWAAAAVIALWKIVRSHFTDRRVFRQQDSSG